jgi:hypothetical protein
MKEIVAQSAIGYSRIDLSADIGKRAFSSEFGK